MKRRTLNWLAVLVIANVVVGGSVFGLAYYFREIPKWTALAEDGKRISARVTSVNVRRGREVSFEYFVDGKRFEGSSRSYAASLLGTAAVGELTYVSYLSTNPEIAEYEDPPSRLGREWTNVCVFTIMALLATVWSPFAIIAYVVSRLRS
ncbi:MAG: hypothetical protein IPM63_12840 [Acidobacteriota bacterium]|nr:MAG: hypothetical protein IPM63_12840 [Acidobacteriota bacterium]